MAGNSWIGVRRDIDEDWRLDESIEFNFEKHMNGIEDKKVTQPVKYVDSPIRKMNKQHREFWSNKIRWGKR